MNFYPMIPEPTAESPSDRETTIPTQPIPISLLSIFPFENTPPLGTFTFLRLIDGDFNETGTIDASDIDAVASAVQVNSADATFDLNSDGLVDSNDHKFIIKQIANTFVGDSNLDGEFNTSDLIRTFQKGEYEDGVLANSNWASGDWNGDMEFDTSDLVAGFQDGGFESGPVAIQSVPEPASLTFTLAAILGLLISRRRNC